MSNSKKPERNLRKEFEKDMGFTPPGIIVAEKLGLDIQQLLADYHHLIWQDKVIPLKYKYLIALASAIFDDHKARTMLELKKAVANGATREEVLEVLRQIVWLKGAPILVKLAPVIRYLDKHLPEETIGD
ncbi:hypothetical protein BBF96_04595 [Anoxybacter fermentans]|uniref:Carboxymuconolactone decarboxylase-like domain-containing protein n=1 Tax=Anoxybacter fermentans TaxID=1323375 RepID=A0A3S9SWW1_9FIRM|nr:carboxymuconolactone decarboxylase family protein [Anoxybacter fermentans]AZR72732.1 hypothetical protein BBF96_04595 [Anoxybacter fermentans]